MLALAKTIANDRKLQPAAACWSTATRTGRHTSPTRAAIHTRRAYTYTNPDPPSHPPVHSRMKYEVCSASAHRYQWQATFLCLASAGRPRVHPFGLLLHADRTPRTITATGTRHRHTRTTHTLIRNYARQKAGCGGTVRGWGVGAVCRCAPLVYHGTQQHCPPDPRSAHAIHRSS